MLRCKFLVFASRQPSCLVLVGSPNHNNGNLIQPLVFRRCYKPPLKETKGQRNRAKAGVKATKKTVGLAPGALPNRPDDSTLQQHDISSAPSPLDVKLAGLKELARTIGVSQTAPKSALTTRITDALRNHTPPPADARILSIDMGIRNLAYALLTPGREFTKEGQSELLRPVVHAWNRVDLRTIPASPLDKLSSAAPSDVDLPGTPVLKEDFSPASLSVMALQLVLTYILPLNPTHILIEKQRFRSAGGSAVLEWTVRVNSLESMLYAIFATLKSLGHFSGVVIPVDPRRVGPFLLESDYKDVTEPRAILPGPRLGAGGKVKLGSKENKKLKIALVGEWLRDGQGVEVDGDAEKMKRAFLKKWLPKVKTTKAEKQEEEKDMEKLDDVADCLLQGVAWLRWEDNKARMVREFGDRLRD